MKKYSLLSLLLSLFFISSQSQTPAFPGAEGGGMYTRGGRGGQVYYVNSLEDNNQGDASTHEGTLRWCLAQKGSRTILFKQSGTIHLNAPLRISSGDVTVAGQSAPGDGICLADHPVSVYADNVIIRYMRLRMGDKKMTEHEADGADAFGGRQHKNIIIDHCSISWSTDECGSFYDNEDFTMQWCIISESLRLSGHSKGPHGYGAIWGGVNATFHHNLLAHHDSRVPRVGPGAKHAGHDTTDIRNNVYYNWNGNGCYGGEAMHINFVNNYYKAGPATSRRVSSRIASLSANRGGNGFDKIKGIWGAFYVAGNYFPASKEVSRDNWKGVNIEDGKNPAAVRLNAPLPITGTIKTDDAKDAYAKVLATAGASYKRDQVDARIVKETSTGKASFKGRSALNGQGGKWKSIGYPRPGIIDSQEDLNPQPSNKNWSAWPELKTKGQIKDSDQDGIPDGWLAQHYPGKKATDVNAEGYTYLEVYLNDIVKDITAKER